MSDNDYMNNITPSNPKIKEGEIKVSIPYIICAAIWFDDRTIHEHQPKNIESGFVVCGRRHHNCFMTMYIMSKGDTSYFQNEKKQGFVTSDDRFVDRKEAGEIAFKAGQINKIDNCLFSEDLY